MTPVTPVEPKRTKRSRLDQQNVGYLLIAPSFLIYLVFVLVPIGWTIVMSFTNYNFKTSKFIGIDNYIKMFSDRVFIMSLWNTLYYSILTILPGMVLGLALAVLLNRKVFMRGFFRTIFYLPNILSMVAIAMAWLYLMDTNAGIINRTLIGMGLKAVPWLSSTGMAMISVAIMSIWASVGYNMVIYLGGLQAIPEYLYEASEIDGVTGWKQFYYITLPLLAPSTFFVFVMACIRSFQVFGQVLILTQGGPVNSTTTIAHQIYRNGFENYQMGYASAQAVALLVITLAITFVNMKYGKGEDNDLA